MEKMNAEEGLPMESEVIEEFWGVELTKDQKTAKWDVEDEGDLGCCTTSTLELRQACLGPGAKEGERNIVQVTVDNGSGKTATFSIVSLKAGLLEQAMVPLNLSPPVVFKLVEGSGPVSIVGTTSETLSFDDDDDSDDDLSEDEAVALGGPLVQKRPATSSLKPPAAKVAKKESEMDTSMKSEDGESDDDEDDEEDEEEDEDDDDSEDDDEDDEEEEEESEEEKPKPIIPRKAQINGKSSNEKSSNGKPSIGKSKTPLKEKPIKLNTSKTPQPLQKTKLQQKGPSSVPPKSASEKKKGMEKKATDINEIKKKLTKMTVPKKMEKFNNFVSNSFKIKDDAVKKELWEHVQKNRS